MSLEIHIRPLYYRKKPPASQYESPCSVPVMVIITHFLNVCFCERVGVIKCFKFKLYLQNEVEKIYFVLKHIPYTKENT